MAGEQRQEWKWGDIFRSIGMAFSFSRLLTGFLGLAFLAVADGLLTWVMKFPIWDTLAQGVWWQQLFGWFGNECLWWIRWIVVGYIFLYTATAIAFSVKSELLEGEGEGVKASIGFVFRKFGTIFRTPITFWIFILLMGGFFAFLFGVFPAVIARWAGWTPAVSLCWYAFWFFLIFIFSVLAAMGFLAFMFSFFLAPPIIATRQEGALDAVLDTIDLMRGKGAFWVATLSLIVAVLLGPVFLGKTFDVGYDVAKISMKDDFNKIVGSMPQEIKPRDDTLMEWTRQFWPGRYGGVHPRRYGTGIKFTSGGTGAGTQHKVAGWMLGIWVLVLAGFSVSFALGAFVAAGTITYLIVREEEEFLEPLTSEPPLPARDAPEPPAAEEPKEAPASEDKKEDEKEDEKEEAKEPTKEPKKETKRGKKKQKKDGKKKG